MTDQYRVTDIRFTPARRAGGTFLGWVCFCAAGFRIDSVAVLQWSGTISLRYPRHIARTGLSFDNVQPVDPALKEAIERAILSELQAQGRIAS